jgi:hypothetical protein
MTKRTGESDGYEDCFAGFDLPGPGSGRTFK